MDDIKTWRKSAGLTQAEMSEMFGIPKRTIEDWDSGKSSPPTWAKRLLIEKLQHLTECEKIEQAVAVANR